VDNIALQSVNLMNVYDVSAVVYGTGYKFLCVVQRSPARVSKSPGRIRPAHNANRIFNDSCIITPLSRLMSLSTLI
jgi:hypothetical protein